MDSSSVSHLQLGMMWTNHAPGEVGETAHWRLKITTPPECSHLRIENCCIQLFTGSKTRSLLRIDRKKCGSDVYQFDFSSMCTPRSLALHSLGDLGLLPHGGIPTSSTPCSAPSPPNNCGRSSPEAPWKSPSTETMQNGWKSLIHPCHPVVVIAPFVNRNKSDILIYREFSLQTKNATPGGTEEKMGRESL